jgi:thioredoxin-dependent peroxiredoxin
MASINVGDLAPEFALKSQDGQVVRLSELLSRGSVVVYFYPKDKTPGCTAEAGAFRDSYSKFSELGAEVVGISSDSVESHEEFR